MLFAKLPCQQGRGGLDLPINGFYTCGQHDQITIGANLLFQDALRMVLPAFLSLCVAFSLMAKKAML